MSRFAIHFSWQTVKEDKSFVGGDSKLLEIIKANENFFEDVFKMLELGKRVIKTDARDFVLNDNVPEDIQVARSMQTLFHIGLARSLEKLMGHPADAVGFYSAGVFPALLHAQVIKFDSSLPSTLSFMRFFFEKTAEDGAALKTRQKLFANNEGEPEIAPYIYDFIQSEKLEKLLFMKDFRSPNAIMMVSNEELLSRLEIHLSAKKINLIKTPNPTPMTTSHTNHFLNNYKTEINKFCESVSNQYELGTPKCCVVGSQGLKVFKGMNQIDQLQDILLSGIFGTLNTGMVFQGLSDHSDKIFLIGSRISMGITAGVKKAHIANASLLTSNTLEQLLTKADS